MKISPHKVNIDAIGEGAMAYLLAFPFAPANPPKPPRGAHAVLWADDWHRGVELAAECFRQTFGSDFEKWGMVGLDGLQPPPDGVTRTVAIVRALASDEPGPVWADDHMLDTANFDQVEVLAEMLSNLRTSGDPDLYRDTEDDHEQAAERDERA